MSDNNGPETSPTPTTPPPTATGLLQPHYTRTPTTIHPKYPISNSPSTNCPQPTQHLYGTLTDPQARLLLHLYTQTTNYPPSNMRQIHTPKPLIYIYIPTI